MHRSCRVEFLAPSLNAICKQSFCSQAPNCAHTSNTMHSFFKPITAEQAQQQVQHFAQQSQQAFEEECALKARAELLRRGPGRPKRERTVDEALSAAAAASSSDSAAAQEQQQQDNSIEEEQQPSKKPKRIHWFDSALIHDILHAYKLSGGSARICAQDLQRNHLRRKIRRRR